MAKISKLNVAITGDSSGLARATDQATTQLRRLRSEQERTQKRIGSMRGTVNQTSEALAKFGASSRLLQMGGGALGLLGLGPAGLALGGVGLAFTAVAAAGTAVGEAIDGMEAERRRAHDVLKQIKRGQIESPLEAGFTQRAIDELTKRQGRFNALEGRGFSGGMALGMAEAPGEGGLMSTLFRLSPFSQTGRGILGMTAGQVLEGRGVQESMQRAFEVGMGQEGMSQSAKLAENLMLYNQMASLANWWSK